MNFFARFFKPDHVMKESSLIPLGNPILIQMALFLGKGKIKFGENVRVGFFPSPYFYSTYAHMEARSPSSEIIIKSNTYISNNACIISNREKIIIGENCRIGANFCLFDSDFHSISPKHRTDPKYTVSKPVSIGDNVFIGQNVTILKGVNIGQNTVIGSGAVVTKSFPDNVVVAGNPAQIVKELKDE